MLEAPAEAEADGAGWRAVNRGEAARVRAGADAVDCQHIEHIVHEQRGIPFIISTLQATPFHAFPDRPTSLPP